MNVTAFVKRGLFVLKNFSHNWSFTRRGKLHRVLDVFSACGFSAHQFFPKNESRNFSHRASAATGNNA